MVERDRLREDIERLTQEMRSGRPGWRLIADQLRERAVDPMTTLLVDLYPEDVHIDHGMVLTGSGDFFEFEIDRDSGAFLEWRSAAVTWAMEQHLWESGLVALGLLNQTGESSSRHEDTKVRAD